MKSILRNLFKQAVGRAIFCQYPSCSLVLDCRTAVEISEPGALSVLCSDHFDEADLAHFRGLEGVEVTTWADVK